MNKKKSSKLLESLDKEKADKSKLRMASLVIIILFRCDFEIDPFFPLNRPSF